MESASVPAELLDLREQIDQVDRDIVLLLAKRFTVTNAVGKLKAEKQLESVDPDREREKLDRLKQEAERHGLNAELVESLFRLVFQEVVKNHRSFLQ